MSPSAQRVVGSHVPLGVQLDAGTFHAELTAVGDAPRRDEQFVGADRARSCRRVDLDHDLVAFPPGRCGRRMGHQVEPMREGLRDPLAHRRILLAQHARSSGDDRDGGTERLEDVAEFGGDEPGAEDREPIGHPVDAHDRVGGVCANLVDAGDRGHVRAGAGGEHESVRGDRLVADLQLLVPDEPGVAAVLGLFDPDRSKTVTLGSPSRYVRPPAAIGSMRPNVRSRISVQRTESTDALTPSRSMW